MGVIVSGFPGVGKTFITQNHDTELKILDAEKECIDFFNSKNFNNEYISFLLKSIYDFDIIFIPYFQTLIESLLLHDVNCIIIYPCETLKTDYIKRFKKRGDCQEFLELVNQNWEIRQYEVNELSKNKQLKFLKLKKTNSFLLINDLLNLIKT